MYIYYVISKKKKNLFSKLQSSDMRLHRHLCKHIRCPLSCSTMSNITRRSSGEIHYESGTAAKPDFFLPREILSQPPDKLATLSSQNFSPNHSYLRPCLLYSKVYEIRGQSTILSGSRQCCPSGPKSWSHIFKGYLKTSTSCRRVAATI